MAKSKNKPVLFVVLNFNGWRDTLNCIESVLQQTYKPFHILLIDNGSADESLNKLSHYNHHKDIAFIKNPTNLGFAGGVNVGIKKAIKDKFDFVALLNNDAIAHKDWLKHLVATLDLNKDAGIATCKLLSSSREKVDSTGDQLTTWGLPYPRDRDVKTDQAHNKSEEVFGASGGASMYRVSMLKDIGLFDKDFFAYYEDVDISFRAQLAGWKVLYEPKAEAYHATGSTSSKIKGFTTYQTFKNYPLLFWKNVPTKLLPKMLPRFTLAYVSIYISSLLGGRGWPATKGLLRMLTLLPKKLVERRKIQKNRKVSVEYINSILIQDLPPNATKLRRLRRVFTGKN